VQLLLRPQQYWLLGVRLLLEWPSGCLLLFCQRPEQLQEAQQLLALLLVLQQALQQLLKGLVPLLVVVTPQAAAGQQKAAVPAVSAVGLVPVAQAQQLVVVVLLLRLAPAKSGTWALVGLLAAAAAA
jgi:hypothetical protein